VFSLNFSVVSIKCFLVVHAKLKFDDYEDLKYEIFLRYLKWLLC